MDINRRVNQIFVMISMIFRQWPPSNLRTRTFLSIFPARYVELPGETHWVGAWGRQEGFGRRKSLIPAGKRVLKTSWAVAAADFGRIWKNSDPKFSKSNFRQSTPNFPVKLTGWMRGGLPASALIRSSNLGTCLSLQNMFPEHKQTWESYFGHDYFFFRVCF